MDMEKFESFLRTLFVQPPVPEGLTPARMFSSFGALRVGRPRAGIMQIAAALLLVSALALGCAHVLHTGFGTDIAVPQTMDVALEAEDVPLTDAAEKTAADADAPSTRPGCLPGCTETQCEPDCPNDVDAV